jgi:hypothetical protein
MRACQKDGLLRLERDRQGALRVFGGGTPRAAVPHGWASAHRENGSEQAADAETPVVDIVPEVIAAPIVEAEITAVVEEGAPAPKARRASRAKKAAPAAKGPKSSTRSRTAKGKAKEEN